MRIEYDIKLGFKDVMIRPKRSTLKSRSQVKLDREFKTRGLETDQTSAAIVATEKMLNVIENIFQLSDFYLET